MLQLLPFVLLGLLAGVLSGLIGIGGGTLIIPVLVFLFGFSQQKAQGTTLAMLVPPVGILAAWVYYRHGQVNLPIAGAMVVGFVLGGLIGADVATALPNNVLSKIFGVAMIAIGVRMIIGR